jgi:RNA polymerase-binding protein DksA
MLTPQQIEEFKRILDQAYANLRETIRQHLQRSDNEGFQELAGQVHDLQDLSVADLLVDVNFAQIDHLLEELRQVEAALRRIREGTYGICVDTGATIELERLRAYPTATRTLEAQAQYEKTHAGVTTPTL